MNIQKARKVLGKEGKNLTDQQISEEINTATVLVDIFLDMWFRMTPEEQKAYKSKKPIS